MSKNSGIIYDLGNDRFGLAILNNIRNSQNLKKFICMFLQTGFVQNRNRTRKAEKNT